MDYYINNETWATLFSHLKTLPFIHTSNDARLRLFIEAIFYIAKTGCQWRLLPKHYGCWRAIHRRYKRWSFQGIWQFLMRKVSDIDDQEIMIDSTIIRAHSCATGYKKGEQVACGLGRTAGGLTSKIHALVDALGNPINFIISPGQEHDSQKSLDLIDEIKGTYLLADKAYDAQFLIDKAKDRQMEVVIPPKKNRIEKRFYDKYRYKERHLIECFFNKIKHFRRIFSRFDKTVECFLGFIYFTSTLIWLR